MSIREAIVNEVLTSWNTKPDDLADLTGSSSITVRNYLSRDLRAGRIRYMNVPGLPHRSSAIIVVWETSLDEQIMDPCQVISYQKENRIEGISVYSDHRQWKMFQHGYRRRTIAHISPFEMSDGSLFGFTSANKTLTQKEESVISTLVLSGNMTNKALSTELGISQSSVSSILERLYKQKAVRKRIVPVYKKFIPDELDQYHLCSTKDEKYCFIPLMDFPKNKLSINMIPILAGGFDFPLVEEIKLWSSKLEEIGGHFLVKTARATGALTLSTPYVRFLPQEELEKLEEEFMCNSIPALGKDIVMEAMAISRKARSAGGLISQQE